MTQSVSQTEYETLAAFRYALRQFLHFSERAAQEVGLTPQQHLGLLAIRGFPDRAGITIGDLAERLKRKHHSVVGLIDRLSAQKLVSRSTGKDDRRQVYVTLTPRGSAVLEKLSAAHRAELRRIGPEIKSLLEQLDSETEKRDGH
jgi:DNA-binding MarR family transcriptional regulator